MKQLPQFDDEEDKDDSVGSIWSLPGIKFQHLVRAAARFWRENVSQQQKVKWSNKSKRLNELPVPGFLGTLPNNFLRDTKNLQTWVLSLLYNDW